jgi:hypothetical protein
MRSASRWSIPLGEWKGEAAFILGGGPSLKDFDAERLRGKGKVVAVNDAGLYMAPWADVLFWADKRWLDWNHDKLGLHTGRWKVTRKAPHIETGHDIRWLDFLPRALSLDPWRVGGWCGGSSAINLAFLLGANPIVLLGFDMRPGNWHANHQKPPLVGQHCDKFIPTLETMAFALEKHGAAVLNANPRSALRCFPFADIDELLSMDDVALAEREKYLAVWQRPEYRRVSPGMLECERAFTVCEMSAGDRLIDFGAGPCRATKWFRDKGLDVTAIDFAPNAREHNDVPFVEACLWSLPPCLKPAHWGFCTDVLEHIPVDRVETVLGNIARLSTAGAYLRIATRPDKMGPRLIGKPLHMTVRSSDWWRRAIEAVFPLVDVIEDTGRDLIVLARH